LVAVHRLQYNHSNKKKKSNTMHEVAALMLCKLGGKAGSADDIKAVLTAAGAEVNEDQLAKLIGDLEGKDINTLLAEGMAKLKDVPMGGGGGGGGGGGYVPLYTIIL
jgi:large subunit ribosomal protein LP2